MDASYNESVLEKGCVEWNQRVTRKKGNESLIKDAVKLHGHLGPFLVLGVRMASLAKRTLNLEEENGQLRITLQVPLFTPFSCTIDGIQASTKCTVGNQKLIIERSAKKIAARFKHQNSAEILRISVNQEILKELTKSISEGITSEELARRVASMDDDQLFVTEKQ
jgi:formylmethanofuran dehydrogenase subunit E